jgi:endonuclease/exonuclease/phosphatase (EEP) superfamily protein YafD
MGETTISLSIKEKYTEGRYFSPDLLAYNLWWTALKDIPATVMERTRNQNHQAEIVLQGINDESGIVIVGCDCNSCETSSSYRILDADLESAARQGEYMVSLDGLPGARQDMAFTHIDYVWPRGGIDPVRVYKILDDGGPDHLPVLALFEMD